MADTILNLPSGATAQISAAPTWLAIELQDAVDAALLQFDISLSEVLNSYSELTSVKDTGVSSAKAILELQGKADYILKAFLIVKSSKIVRELVFECLKRCLYNKLVITKNTFEKEEARQDYYPIFLACLKENLLPFFQSLL